MSEKQSMENNLIAGTTIGAGVILPLFSATAGAQWVSTFNGFGRMYMIIIFYICNSWYSDIY